MSSNQMPYKPWLRQLNYSSSSLVSNNMEIEISPGQIPPSSPAARYINKELPKIPSDYGEFKRLQRRKEAESRRKRNTISTASYEQGDDSTLPLTLSTNSGLHSSPPPLISTPSFVPPMTKSSHKILQLTGYDARFEKTFPLGHQQTEVSPTSDDSSSKYSQDELALAVDDMIRDSGWDSAAVFPQTPLAIPDLRSPNYQVKQQQPNTYTAPLRPLREGFEESLTKETVIHINPNSNLDQLTTLRELLAKEQIRVNNGNGRYLNIHGHRDYTEAEINIHVPKPLAIRTKNRAKLQSPTKRSSLLSNARESWSRGIAEITTSKNKRFSGDYSISSPIQKYQPNTPRTPNPPFSPESQKFLRDAVPSPLQVKNQKFGSGNHPLKSPFPFLMSIDTSDSVLWDVEESTTPKGESGTSKFSKRLSGAIKQISGGPRVPAPRKNSIITNRNREVDGPDTPLPRFSGFQDAFVSAKKGLKIISADKRKRESLKNRIVVVGITDQSPDGRISEWL